MGSTKALEYTGGVVPIPTTFPTPKRTSRVGPYTMDTGYGVVIWW